MSIRLTQLVWKTELNLLPGEHHVLLCLANFANDKNDLLCCPKISTIAKLCHLSTRQTIRIIKQLDQLGIIKKISHKDIHNPSESNTYIINELALKGEITELVDDMMSPTTCHGVTSLGDMVSPNNKEIDNINNKYIVQRDTAARIVSFLRKKTGRNYTLTDTTYKLIKERFKEGATEEQFKQIIARKHMEWAHDKKMEKYIRPQTLFTKTNFWDKYKPELVTDEDKEKIMQEG